MYRWTIRTLAVVFGILAAGTGQAELTDLTQTPNAVNEGIVKSLDEQVGAGQGDVTLPGSSSYLIARDPFRSIRRGRQLFQRKFTLAQGLGPRMDDGIGGDIQQTPALGAGLADSCAACHGRPRGSAGVGGDVFTRPDSRDAPHLFGLGLQEMLADEMTTELRAIRSRAIADAATTNHAANLPLVSKGVRFGSILANSDGTLDTSGVRGVDADLRVKPFFAHGGAFSIRQFVVGAFNDEMGLQAPDSDLATAAAGGRVTTRSGFVLDGALDRFSAPAAAGPNDDPDGDGVSNEIDVALIDHMEFYLLNYFKPATYRRTAITEMGRRAMEQIGCTDCHRPSLVIDSDRRVADVETTYDPTRGIFNNLFATAAPLFREVTDDPTLPALRQPLRGRFVVNDFYADMKRHDLGPNFWERNFDGSLRREIVTEPLWGVGTTAPYGHDGRSINLQEVILRHGGEAERSRNLYAAAPAMLQLSVRAFLESLVIFPPDDTASNLNPGDRAAPNFPQRGHGSIRLPVLFLDPTELE
jgi:Di-haem oxidoreductase, putative peroxidase